MSNQNGFDIEHAERLRKQLKKFSEQIDFEWQNVLGKWDNLKNCWEDNQSQRFELYFAELHCFLLEALEQINTFDGFLKEKIFEIQAVASMSIPQGDPTSGYTFEQPLKPLGSAGSASERSPHDLKDTGSAADNVAQPRPRPKGSDDKIPEIVVDASKYPESAQHIRDAQSNGHPSELTINRSGSKANRRKSLKNQKSAEGKDRDEYPPAMFQEGGDGASVRPIVPGDNRGAGSSMGHQARPYDDGTIVRIVVRE